MLRIMLLIMSLSMGIMVAAYAADLAPREREKIDYLIASIESLKDAEFISDRTTYEASSAGKQLRLNLNHAASRIKTADDFIKYCASVSTVSGTPYQIRFSDGRVVATQTYLQKKLLEFKAPHNSSKSNSSKPTPPQKQSQ